MERQSKLFILMVLFIIPFTVALDLRTIYNPFAGHQDYYHGSNWSGNNITADYFIGNGSQLTDIQQGKLNWSYLQNYPVACPAGSYITQLDDSITCTAAMRTTGENVTGDYSFDGNVGIGTETPIETLHVNGSAFFNGNLIINGTLTVNGNLIVNGELLQNISNRGMFSNSTCQVIGNLSYMGEC